MTATPPWVARQEFDSECLGLDFYRLLDPTVPRAELAEFLDTLRGRAAAVDARVDPGSDAAREALPDLGFQRTSTQLVLEAPPGVGPEDAGVELHRGGWNASDELKRRHAENFRLDRLSQDGRFDRAAVARFHRTWIDNSCRNPAIDFLVLEGDFSSYRQLDGVLTVDLVSCLQKRRGHGRRLMTMLLARGRSCRAVRVTTEAENVPSLRLYAQVGFVPVEARLRMMWHSNGR